MNQKSIYVYAPSGAVRDKTSYRRSLKHLQKLGYAVQADEAALLRVQRFAGDDATRLAAIGRAAAAGADLALIARGGYGLTRLLPHIDYAAVGQSIANGTAWMGFSDFTALQLALLAQLGVGQGSHTWAGLSLCDDVAGLRCEDGQPDEVTLACMEDVIWHHAEGAGWRMSAAQGRQWLASGGAETLQIEQAPLWGGNLCVLTALLGTPYFPDFKDAQRGVGGGILFLEDVAEHPYRIERMLTQLLHAGVLAQQRAIVLGAFNDYTLSPHDKGFDMRTVVAWLRAQLPQVPVLEGLPFGHIDTKVCLPVGLRVDLHLEGRDVLLLWEPPGGHAHAHAHVCGADCDGEHHHAH